MLLSDIVIEEKAHTHLKLTAHTQWSKEADAARTRGKKMSTSMTDGWGTLHLESGTRPASQRDSTTSSPDRNDEVSGGWSTSLLKSIFVRELEPIEGMGVYQEGTFRRPLKASCMRTGHKAFSCLEDAAATFENRRRSSGIRPCRTQHTGRH